MQARLLRVLTEELASSDRLRGVPIPVIEEVIEHAFNVASAVLHPRVSIEDLFASIDDTLEECGDCELLIPIGKMEVPGLYCPDCAPDHNKLPDQ